MIREQLDGMNVLKHYWTANNTSEGTKTPAGTRLAIHSTRFGALSQRHRKHLVPGNQSSVTVIFHSLISRQGTNNQAIDHKRHTRNSANVPFLVYTRHVTCMYAPNFWELKWKHKPTVRPSDKVRTEPLYSFGNTKEPTKQIINKQAYDYSIVLFWRSPCGCTDIVT
jgi:hypothetical protein